MGIMERGRFFGLLLSSGSLLLGMAILAKGAAAATIQVEGVAFDVPEGWQVFQDGKSDGLILLGFAKGNDHFSLYVKPGQRLDLKAMFMNGAQLVADVAQERHGSFSWDILQTKKSTAGQSDIFVTGFQMVNQGNLFYGYGRGSSASASAAIVHGFLNQSHGAR